MAENSALKPAIPHHPPAAILYASPLLASDLPDFRKARHCASAHNGGEHQAVGKFGDSQLKSILQDCFIS